jgi:hypothetical protein
LRTSDETLRLEIYANLPEKCSAINLAGQSSLTISGPHFRRSLQVAEAVPEAAGAGSILPGRRFPGIAIKYADAPGALVHLVEANQRGAPSAKCIRETSAPAMSTAPTRKIPPPRREDRGEQRGAPLEALLATRKIHRPRRGWSFFQGKTLEAELTDSLTGGKYF